MSDQPSYYLRKLKAQYVSRRGIEISLWSLAVGVLAFALAYVFDSKFTGLITVLSFIGTWTILYFVFRINKIDAHKLLSYINRKYPELQESADLLIKDENSLTSLETIQLSKTIEQLHTLSPALTVPHNIGKATLGLLATSVIVLLLTALDIRSDSSADFSGKKSETNETSQTKSTVPASLEEYAINVNPPAYTGQKYYNAKSFDLKVPEGSVISWDLTFNQALTSCRLLFAGKDSLLLKAKNGKFAASRKVMASTIYQMSWTDTSGVRRSSDYYQIEVVPDKAPEVSFLDLRQSIELTVKDKPTLDLKAKISDDYAITDAYIIATVAKGSGESVKFREEKIRFSKPQNVKGKSLQAEKTIDIKKLGLEPGDELYFYAEAFDNQQPTPNRSRTETFFITLLDTAAQESVVDAGLGVDLMPEYFRSQRQIIMDTEKLLRNKKTISKKEFNFLSNELGYDQKVLRLKYGEFLGEEFESELAPSDEGAEEQVEAVVEEANEGEEDMAEKFGHAHDTENEHNLVGEKKSGHNHDEPKDPEAKENPLEAFVHAHDDAEEATFFLQSVRTKLKAALTEMWDAELYLRLYEPEKSLPYQYKALKLLKEVSNDSRIYVHKTGFDPPPIKEEKRLTGDLAEIKNSKRDANLSAEALYPAIRNAIKIIDETLHREKLLLTSSDKESFTKAGHELSALALQNPSKYLSALSWIKNIQEDQIKSAELRSTLVKLQKVMYAAVPLQETNASTANGSTLTIDQSFIQNLEKLKND
ncbi:MAG TPA: DUF4175 family protein [Chryseosolibacter sp.]